MAVVGHQILDAGGGGQDLGAIAPMQHGEEVIGPAG